MKFSSRGGVSIFELIFYLPAVVAAFIDCSRHGFSRSSGWVFTLVLCLVRIAGACCQLATYHSETTGLIEAIVILDSIGISPLLLATLGLLSRCADSILLITVGLILCIVGGTSSTSSSGGYQTQPTTKAGVALYLVAFVALSLMAIVMTHKLSNAPTDDKRLAWTVIIALPFILVRIIYSLISVFSHIHSFNRFTGSVAILVVMGVLEEMAVVSLYLMIGWKLKATTTLDRGGIASRPWKGNLEGGRGARGGHGKRRQGPIHALVGAGIEAVQNRKEKPETMGP